MSVLYERTVAALAGGRAANDLADALDLDSGEDARAAAMVAVPAVLSNMARVASSPVGAIGLSRMARAQLLHGVTGVGSDGSGQPVPPGDAVAALLGSRSEIVVEVVAQRVGLQPMSAEWLLGHVLAGCLRSLARELGPSVERSMVAPVLTRERLDLIEDGWGTWINRCLGNGNPSDLLDLARHISLRAPEPVEPLVTRPRPRSEAASSDRVRGLAWWLISAVALAAIAGALLATLA